ncbi:tautomerase family protein [Streptomyces luteogriseus]|uniref:tautomerase family protein n=1 Tax=Streptomyces luteogriseus TaxID=68233 RepID=UPI003811B2CF
MPFVAIELIRGRRPEGIRAIADATHRAIVDVLEIPERDRFQVITEHDADHVVALDAGRPPRDADDDAPLLVPRPSDRAGGARGRFRRMHALASVAQQQRLWVRAS